VSAYQKTVSRVMELDRRGIFLGLSTTKRALRGLGKPQRRFPAILVAGTNGKGSTVSMLSSILNRAGYKVGKFVSPHLLDIRERIQVGDKMISKRDFSNLSKKLFRELPKNKNGEVEVSFFEFITVMGFLHFANEAVDIAIVEVGLGGRFDATNVLSPLISVITTIGMDHQRFLGNTLNQISGEKAGVMRHRKSIVTGVTQTRIRKHLRDIAQKKGAVISVSGQDFRVRQSKQGFSFNNKYHKWSGLRLSLKGDFQVRNAGVALQVISLLKKKKWHISEEAIRMGFLGTVWPARVEIVQLAPQVLIDAAHNVEGLRALFQTLKKDFSYRRLHMMMGVMEDKNYRAMIKFALESSDRFYFVEPHVKRALRGEVLVKVMPQLKGKVELYKEIHVALPKVLKRLPKADLLCITGSLYTASEAKKSLMS